MREIVDGAFAYAVGTAALFSSVLWEHRDEITTVGGLIVLGFRLYVDGSRAYRKWRGKND